MGNEVIETMKDALDLNVIEEEERQEATRFAETFGQNYLTNKKYEQKDVVDAINAILTKLAKTSKRLVEFILEALRLMFPETNKKYPFQIIA